MTTIVSHARFIKSSAEAQQCPTDGRAEVTLIGRSNVGKSSLINSLLGNRSLAKTSASPGKTRLINHFLVNESWYLVDLPGYGYAKTSKQMRQVLGSIIEDYFTHRAEELRCVFVLIDLRLPPQPIDLQFLRWLGTNGVPLALVFTKADKLSGTAAKANCENYLLKLSEEWESAPAHFITSAKTSLGREALLTYMNKCAEAPRL